MSLREWYEQSDFDLHDRVKQSRFYQRPPHALPGPSEHERAETAFGALSQDQQDMLTGWLVATIRKAVPSRAADWFPMINVLYSSALGEQANAELHFTVDIRAMNGGLLALDYCPLRLTGDGPNWAVGAAYKDS